MSKVLTYTQTAPKSTDTPIFLTQESKRARLSLLCCCFPLCFPFPSHHLATTATIHTSCLHILLIHPFIQAASQYRIKKERERERGKVESRGQTQTNKHMRNTFRRCRRPESCQIFATQYFWLLLKADSSGKSIESRKMRNESRALCVYKRLGRILYWSTRGGTTKVRFSREAETVSQQKKTLL